MTEPDIRDLLTELVEPLEAPDLAGSTWDRSVRRRQQRRTAVGAGVAVGALAIAGGAPYVRNQGESAAPTNPSPTATTTNATQSQEPVPMIDGYRVWKAPRLEDEASLESVSSFLPATIDLSAPNPSVQQEPIDSAVAAFGIAKIVGNKTRFDGVMLMTSEGELRHLDASQLDPVANPLGDSFSPFSAGSLSPDGSKIAFRQTNGVAIYDLPTNEWATYDLVGSLDSSDAPVWSPDGGTVRVGFSAFNLATERPSLVKATDSTMVDTGLSVESWHGADRILDDKHAQAASYLHERIPVGGVDPDPPAIVVAGGGRTVLVIPDQYERWKDCCAVAGWLDENTVAYESNSGSAATVGTGQIMHILAWDTTNGEVRRVSTVTGSADMLFLGSYADLLSSHEG